MDALAGDARLTVAQRVPPPQLDRIDAERLGNHVHVTLAGEHRLWVARRAHRTTRNAVGVDGSGLEPGHRHVVRGERVVRGNHQVGRDLAGGIRTTVDGHLRLMSQERAVVAHGRAECHDGRMPRVAGLQLVDVAHHRLDRPARRARQEVTRVFVDGQPLAAEITPDRLLGYLGGVPETYGADARPKKLEWMIRQAGSIAGK